MLINKRLQLAKLRRNFAYLRKLLDNEVHARPNAFAI